MRLGRVDLRKVAGEVNPADLFTKHSLSRQRLEQLVELHGCQYMGGRAASAPLAKTGESNKATMASGLSHSPNGIGALSGDVELSGSEDPIMPHLSLTPHELEERYPSMRAPADDRMEDFLKDEDDTVFKHGMKIAEEIRAAMKSEGRTRYRAPLDNALVDGSRECGYRRLDEHRPSRTSHVAAIDNLEWCYVGLLSEPTPSVAGPRAAVPRDTSRGENYEPNTEEEEVELHHRAGLTSPVRQACRGLYEKEEKVDDNNCGYLPVANAICRRSAKVRYPLATLILQLRPLRVLLRHRHCHHQASP